MTESPIESELAETIIDNPEMGEFYEKPCTHTWKRYVCAMPPPQVVNYAFWYKTNYQYRWAYSYRFPSIFRPTLASIGAGAYAARAFRAMQPHVNDGLSLVNFVLELKDFRRMWAHWVPFTRELGNIARSSRGSPLRLIMRLIAESHLNIQFGWRPFLSDINQMIGILGLIDKRLKYLEENAGKVVRRHYREAIDGPLGSETTTDKFVEVYIPFFTPVNTYKVRQIERFRWVSKPMYHASMVFRFNLPKASPFRRQLDAFRAALGLKLDPAIVWNAIPFSFIIDWFYDVGEFLRQFSESDLGITTEVIDFSHSVKYHHLAEVSYAVQDVNSTWLPQLDIVHAEESYYERAKFTPNTFQVTSSTPGLMQASLAGALLATGGAYRHRRPSALR